jgi:putative oxidoreductase
MKILTKNFGNYSAITGLLRIILGIIFFAHGAQKVMGWFGGPGLATAADMFQKNAGIPYPLFLLSSFTEFLGGLFVLIGLLTRIFSAGLFINMAVAVLQVHLMKGLFSANGGFEYPLTLLVVSLCIFLMGPGKYSLDNLIFNKNEKPNN